MSMADANTPEPSGAPRCLLTHVCLWQAALKHHLIESSRCVIFQLECLRQGPVFFLHHKQQVTLRTAGSKVLVYDKGLTFYWPACHVS